jgi:hypothetical protein
MGERDLQRQKVDHLGECQRDHREIKTLPADSHEPEHHAEHGCGSRPDQGGKLEREPPHLEGVPRHVSAGAEKRRMAEGEKPDRPEQVECAREQAKAQDLCQEQRIGEKRCDHEDRKPDRVGDDRRHAHLAGEQTSEASLRSHGACGCRRHDYRSRPNNPAGLISSTMNMMTKITMLAPGG